jgi:hypothetical protein
VPYVNQEKKQTDICASVVTLMVVMTCFINLFLEDHTDIAWRLQMRLACVFCIRRYSKKKIHDSVSSFKITFSPTHLLSRSLLTTVIAHRINRVFHIRLLIHPLFMRASFHRILDKARDGRVCGIRRRRRWRRR